MKIKDVCLIPFKIMLYGLNVMFLPEGLRNWLFGTGTRALEVLNSSLLLTWGVISLLNAQFVELLPTYAHMKIVPTSLVSIIFFFLGIAQLVYALRSTADSNIISGYFLIVSSFVWAIIAVGYWGDYPPIKPGMVLYLPLALVNWWAGVLIIDIAKEQKNQYKIGA